jgi:hypothetical protein
VQEGRVEAWASPTLNQEVVTTLLEVLLTHEVANAAIEDALARRAEAPLREGLGADLHKSIASAALLEARLTAIEWSQVALLALSGTQVSLLFVSVCPQGFSGEPKSAPRSQCGGAAARGPRCRPPQEH